MRNCNPVWMKKVAPAQFDWETGLYDYWDMSSYNLSPGWIIGDKGVYLNPEGSSNFQSGNFPTAGGFNCFQPVENNANFRSNNLSTSNWSVSFWYKYTGNLASVLASRPYFDINVSGESFDSITVWDGITRSLSWAGKTSFTTTGFNHIVINYNAGNWQMFLNGVLLGSVTIGNISDGDIGSGWDDASYKYYTELAIWKNRNLTEEEVTLLYNDGLGLFY